MSTLFIAEFSELARDASGYLVAAKTPAIASQAVSFTTATDSSAFSASTRFIRVVSATACHLSFSGDATTSSGHYLPAGAAEYIGVSPGDTVSVIDAA